MEGCIGFILQWSLTADAHEYMAMGCQSGMLVAPGKGGYCSGVRLTLFC